MTQDRRRDHATRQAVDRAVRRELRARMRMEWGRIFVMVLLVLSVWLSAYQGRQDLVASSRKACERGKLDRVDNAAGWESAEQARRATATDRANPGAERASAALAADSYKAIKESLQGRSRIDCRAAFPDAQILPF